MHHSRASDFTQRNSVLASCKILIISIELLVSDQRSTSLPSAPQQVITNAQNVQIGGVQYHGGSGGGGSGSERLRSWTKLTEDEARVRLDLASNGFNMPRKSTNTTFLTAWGNILIHVSKTSPYILNQQSNIHYDAIFTCSIAFQPPLLYLWWYSNESINE